ncbi:MAG: hypothetical protein IH789_04510 [Acidobacteria bacterium]|nr:hypothetical protein [Acidobacteriota bacterium]
MKKYMTTLVLLAGLGVLVASPAAVAESGSVFEKFKALAGEWEGQRSGGGSVKVSYQVLSGDSAVVEILTELAEEVTMVTVYHMDGNDLRITHYCAAKNQPRMKAAAVSPDARVVSFEFVDATNLAQPTDGHMHNFEITFKDRNHIAQKWTWLENGRKRESVFHLARVR